MQDGLLDIAVYPDFTKAEVLQYFAKTAKENAILDGKLQRYRAGKVKIKTSPKLAIAANGITLARARLRSRCFRAHCGYLPPRSASVRKSHRNRRLKPFQLLFPQS
jgi:diacylglycerol kinase family enzyme